MARVRVLSTFVLALALLLAPPARAQLTADQAVVVDFDLGTLYVVDATSLSVASSLFLGTDVIDVTITPDGGTALVTSFGGNLLTFVDLTTSPPTNTGSISIPLFAEDVEVSCAGTGFAVITDGGTSTNVVSVDLTTRTVVSNLFLPFTAETNAITSDGSQVLVGSWQSGNVTLLDMSPSGVLTYVAGRTVDVGSNLHNVSILPGDQRALVTANFNELAVVDFGGGSISHAYTVTTFEGLGQSLALAPSGDRAYMLSCTTNTISLLDIDAMGDVTWAGSFSHSGLNPRCFFGVDQLAISPGGERLFVRNLSGVSIFDTATLSELALVPLGAQNLGGGVATLCSGGPQAARLAFQTRPALTQVQGDTWPPFEVRVEDENGDLFTDAEEPVTVGLLSGSGVLSGTTTRVPVGGIATFDDLAYDTAETISIVATSPDLLAVGATVIVTPANSDLRILASDITFTPSGASIEVGQSTLIEARVRNVGSAEATATVSFWRGDPDIPAAGAQLIGSFNGSVPLGGSTTFSTNWTPLAEGLQSIFVIVDNTTPNGTDSTPEDNRATRQASVGAAAEELAISAGERIAWPGASTSVPITITNIGFGPATITATNFGPPSWLMESTPLVGTTLQPGESLLALVQLNVPVGTPGAPLNSAPLVQAVPVAIDTASGTFADDLIVKLFDQAASSVTVRVVDDDTGNPLANALVAAEDLPGSFVTGAPSGEVVLQLPPGPSNLFAYRTGYIARASSFDIPQGASTVEMRLTPGQTLGVSQVVSEPLSTQEIIDRGVNVNDPVNNDVYDFTVALNVGAPLVVRNVELPREDPVEGSVTFTQILPPPPPPDPIDPNSGQGFGGGVLVTARFDYNAFGRTETWIIIPGQVWALKQFFEVTTYVVNNANAENPEDVQLVDVMANLNLPSGLAFPDLDGMPQNATQSLGTLDAQESAQAAWVIRGDLPGSYQLNGLVTGDLFAFGSFQTGLSALATSDPFDVTVARIRCEFLTPEFVFANTAFNFGVLVTNEAATRANLVRVILEEADLTNCTLEGTEGLQAPEVSFQYDGGGNVLSATYTIGDLAPATSGLAEFQLISLVGGTIDFMEVENGCGKAPSPPVSVTPQPPSIVDQPDAATACPGAVATFEVTADGFAPVTYQWRKDGVAISGATGTVYSIGMVGAGDAGSYDVVVTNPGGEVVSDGAILTVLSPPSLLEHPLSLTLCENDEAVFSVSAAGDPAPTFQWRKDGVALAGATGASLTIPGATPANAGSYDVVVSNPCGSATSMPATLIVQVAPTFTSHPMSLEVCDGDAVSFSALAEGDPAPTYQWRKDGVDIPGATSSTYTIGAPTPDDDGTYDVVATNACGFATSGMATLTVRVAPVVDQQPQSQVVCQGEGDVTFSVTASGVPAPEYQWRKDGIDIDGATGSSLTIAAPTPADDGSYDVVVSNTCGSTTSDAASLEVQVAPSITADLSDELVTEGESVTFEVTAAGVPEPTYQWFKDEVELAGETGSSLTIDPVEGADGGTYTVVATNDCGTAESSAALTVNLLPEVTCTGAFELWSPNHNLIDVSSVFDVTDPDGDAVTLSIRVFADEPEIPEAGCLHCSGDGTGKFAPDFKNELYEGGRGLLLRTERKGSEDGRWYAAVITADDGRGGVVTHVCGLAAAPHDQSEESMADVMAQLATATAEIQAALDAAAPGLPALPLAGHFEHGLSDEVGPKQ